MKILLRATRGVSDAHEVTEPGFNCVEFSTRVQTDFGEGGAVIQLKGAAIIKLIDDFKIEKVNANTSMTISASHTALNVDRLLSTINGSNVSLEIK